MMRVLHVFWLAAVWLALWSDWSVANALSGMVVALAVTAIFGTWWKAGRIVLRPIRVLEFAAYFFYKLLEASLVVARTVITPRGRIRAGIVAVPLGGCSEAVATIIADAISLTPGTLTLEVRRDPLTLYVHVLHVRDVEQVRRDVRALEVLAVRAFGGSQALAALAQDDTASWEGSS